MVHSGTACCPWLAHGLASSRWAFPFDCAADVGDAVVAFVSALATCADPPRRSSATKADAWTRRWRSPSNANWTRTDPCRLLLRFLLRLLRVVREGVIGAQALRPFHQPSRSKTCSHQRASITVRGRRSWGLTIFVKFRKTRTVGAMVKHSAFLGYSHHSPVKSPTGYLYRYSKMSSSTSSCSHILPILV